MNNFLKASVFLVILLLFSFVYYKTNIAANCNAVTTGNWSNGATWSGCGGVDGIPGNGDNITIDEGVDVTLDTNSVVVGSLIIDGSLVVSSDFTFSATRISVSSNGLLDATGSGTTFILNNDNSVLLTVNSGGQIIAGNSTFKVSSTGGDVTFFSGSGITLNNVEMTPNLVSSRNYLFNDDSLTISNLTINPLGAGDLVVSLGGNLIVNGDIIIQPSESATATLSTENAGTTYNVTTQVINLASNATFTANDSDITLTSDSTGLIIDTGTLSAGSSNFIFNGGDGVTPVVPILDSSGSVSFYDLTLSPILVGGFADTYYTLGTETITVNNDLVVSGSAISEPGLFSVILGGGVSVAGTTTLSFTGASISDLSTAGQPFSTGSLNVTSTGQLTTDASTITISNNITNNGSFLSGTSNVILNGNNTATITGAIDFYDLTITSSGAKEINFSRDASHIIGVTHIFTVTGAVNNLIKLYSDLATNKWHFHPTGTASVSYATIRDGGCESGAITITPTNSTDSGNNESCWSLTSAPTAPLSLAGTAGNSEVVLTWSAPSSNGGASITDYVVEYAVSAETPSWSTFSDGVSATTGATVTSLTNGTTYLFKVSAVNSIGTGTATSNISVTPVTTPGIPTGLTGIASSGAVALDWTAPASNGGASITDYVVEYKLTTVDSWTTFSDGTSTATSATVTSLANGVSYHFRISAVNAVGTGTTGDVASVAMPSIAVSNSGSALLINKEGPNMKKVEFSINNGIKDTNNKIIPIKIKAGNDVNRMAISNTPDFQSVGIIDFESDSTFDLCYELEKCEAGNYTVYLRLYTIWGYDSETLSREIYFDSESKFETEETVEELEPKESFQFTKNLTLFDIGEEVKKLQEFLNEQGFYLSKYGAGSDGNETMFFGFRTRKALTKFQEEYYKDILEPAGFKKGTGIFGDFTRNFVNSKFFGQ